MSAITVDLNPQSEKFNVRQREYFDVVMGAVSRHQQLELLLQKIKHFTGDADALEGMTIKQEALQTTVDEDDRFFFYGGGASGGKTHISITILCMLSKIYPRSRWHIVRESYPSIIQNVVPPLQEILRYSEGIYWKKQPQDFFCQFENGSRIYCIAENLKQDRDLNKFKGLQTNGFLLEQIEELSFETFNKCIERAGRWYGVQGVMPPPIILSTFNPTYNWVKKKIHDPWVKGQLEKRYYYQKALPEDNKYNTKDQWDNWSKMDSSSYKRFILGDWEIDVEGQFFTGFDVQRNVTDQHFDIDKSYDIWLSFDFNVDPMTCIVAQTDHRSFLRVIKEFRIPNSDTPAMCDAILAYSNIKERMHTVYITGDASGKNRMSGLAGHINHYQIIKTKFGLNSWDQFKGVPSANPRITDSRMLTNAILESTKNPTVTISSTCEHLINDMKFLTFARDKNGEVEINKTGVNKYLGVDNKEIGHLSDCFRYLINATFTDWLQIPKS